MNLTEAILDIFKAYGVGTIRTWANGKKYQKQQDGKWKEVKSQKQKVTNDKSNIKEYTNANINFYKGDSDFSEQDAIKFVKLAGIPIDFEGDININGYDDYLNITASNNDISMERDVYPNDLYIENVSFTVSNKNKYSGSEVFYKQVVNAKNLGYKEIVTSAKRSETVNGYYTWLRLGYLPDSETEKKYSKKLSNQLGFKVDSILPLMYTSQGRDWWRKNGGSFEGTFDLSDNSYSMKTLNDYINERRKKSNS